jgi:hypothetical protein
VLEPARSLILYSYSTLFHGIPRFSTLLIPIKNNSIRTNTMRPANQRRMPRSPKCNSRAAWHVPRGDEAHSFPGLERLKAQDFRLKTPHPIVPLRTGSYHFVPHRTTKNPRNTTLYHIKIFRAQPKNEHEHLPH